MESNETNTTSMPLAQRIVRILASYGLAVVLLFFLLILTLLGTLEQAEFGLYVVQEKYFNSLFLVHRFFGTIPVPLPGVYLLLVVLFVNLTLGGILRAFRVKKRRSVGVLIAHSGLILLLVGGFISHHFAINGSMNLYEGKSSDEFESYYDWVVEVRRLAPSPSEKVWVIPAEDLQHAGEFGTQRFTSPDMPFDLTFSHYLLNCNPIPGGAPPSLPAVDGVSLRPLPRNKEAEANVAGVYVESVDKQGGGARQAVLWGYANAPYAFDVGGERWMLDMTRRKWRLPFTVLLDDFTVELYPNTRTPKVFRSDVTKIENGVHESIKISMNAPLRHKGFTLFQASWGPQDAAPGAPLFSGFAVVHNPADHWPLYSCVIVGIGMVIHFLQKLVGYLRRRTT